MTKTVTKTILEQLNTLVLTLNEDGEVRYVSPSAKRLLGYDSSLLLGDGWWDLTRLNQSDRLAHRSEIIDLFKNKLNFKPIKFEREIKTNDGTTRWIQWNISISEDLLIGVGHDITEQKTYERKLAEKNNELEKAFANSRRLNKDITDSIIYSQRIQQAILPETNGLQIIIPNSFILHKPKDIVSGDFFWYHRVNNKVFVAAVDCTGHGVPGAIMSVIGNNLIREAVIKKGIEDPADVLSYIDKELETLLYKSYSGVRTSDGMDVSLVVIDYNSRTINFSGAFRPLTLLRDGKIIEFKGNRYPIGFFDSLDKKFITQRIPILPDDRIFLYSDGYIDQFGGHDGKKLNRKRFFDFILSSQNMDVQEQGAYLEYSFNNWKQNEIQTDDVLLIGIKI